MVETQYVLNRGLIAVVSEPQMPGSASTKTNQLVTIKASSHPNGDAISVFVAPKEIREIIFDLWLGPPGDNLPPFSVSI